MLRTGLFFITALTQIIKQSSMIPRLWHCVSKINKMNLARAENSFASGKIPIWVASSVMSGCSLTKKPTTIKSSNQNGRPNGISTGAPRNRLHCSRLARTPSFSVLSPEFGRIYQIKKLSVFDYQGVENGSSPLARGTLWYNGLRDSMGGIKPARAGNSLKYGIRYPD